MPKPYSLDLRERVVGYVEAGHSRRAAAAHFRVSPSFVINLMTAFRERGAVAPKALGGWRHSKLDPHRVFILRRVAEKDDISMPELAGELHAASGVKAALASLSRWLIRNGLSFKKRMARPVRKRLCRDWLLIQSASTYPASEALLPAKMEIRAFRSS